MKYIYLFLFLSFQLAMSQKDFSNQWQDLYAYNNVKDFTIVDSKLYAISNNAMFIYDIDTDEIQKISSVNGLSGTTTSSLSFDEKSSSIIVGYQNGLVEIISENNTVIPLTGVRDNLILVDKIVNGFYANASNSYIFGDFGISETNINTYEFGDTYRLSNNGVTNSVNQITIANNVLYAATANGLFQIDLNLDPINFANWTQVSSGNITTILSVENNIYFVKDANIYNINNPTTSIISASDSILSLNVKESTKELIVTTSSLIEFYNPITFAKTDEVDLLLAVDYNIATTKALVNNNQVYVNTNAYGVLRTSLTDKINYTELHPDGPSANDVFSITVSGNQKWMVYGGHNASYNGLGKNAGVDYFVNGKWNHLTNSQVGAKKDYLKAIVDPLDGTKVLIASLRDGVTEINNFTLEKIWNRANTNNILPGHLTTGEAFVGNMIVDNNNKIWTANSRALNNQFFSQYNGAKDGVDRWELKVTFPDIEGSEGFVRGFNKMSVDQNNNIYAASARTGVFVFNANPVENEADRRVAVLDNSESKGQLLSNFVSCAVADENNKIWIGTDLGLVVFDDYENLYSPTKSPAKKIIIEEGGIAREFLGETAVNEILIDQANNKWFATNGAGVIYTSSDAQTTFNIFNSANSPLPSDNVIDLELDKETGIVYMVTDKGVLAYDIQSEPFGTKITKVIAYPNPAIRNRIGHEQITIVARDGNGIPDGTNVKILDVSGKLVFETNVRDDGQSQGGKVVWNKKNLRGNSVASGIYIVLLSNANGTETTTTKIAIVN